MKVIKNKWIPFKGYKCINLFGILFTKSDLSDKDINHEAIHTKQMQEMLYIFFYLWYWIEYIVRRFSNSQHKAYKKVSFEQEAYYYESNLAYLRWRKRYSWLKFL